MRDLSLRFKVAMVAAVAGLVVLALGALIWAGSRSIQNDWESLAGEASTKQASILEFRAAMGYGGATYHFGNYLVLGDLGELTQLEEGTAAAHQALESYRGAGSLTSAEKAALERLEGLVAAYERAAEEAPALIEGGASPAEVRERMGVDDGPYLAALGELSDEADRVTADASESFEKHSDRLVSVLLPALPLAAALVVVSVYVATDRMVARPLRRITSSSRALAAGELDGSLDVVASRDEMGELASACRQVEETFRLISDVARAIASGDLSSPVLAQRAPRELGANLASMVSSLQDTAAKLDAISRGRTDVTFRSRGEGDVLAQAATRMRDAHQALARSARELEEANVRKDAVLRQLASVSDEISRAVGTLTNQSAELTDASTSLMSDADRTAERSRELDRSVRAVDEGLGAVATSTEQLNRAIEAIRTRVSRAGEQTAMAVDDMARVREVVDRLDSASTEIGDVVGIIGGVAEQIHLLALNAAIEAARAGEAGRGFGIVAKEIRTLAKETSESVIDIEQQVQGLRNTSEAVSIAASSIERVVRELDRIAAAIVTEVASQAEATAQVDQRLGTAARDVHSIAGAVAVLHRLAESSQAGARQVLAAARHLAELADRLDVRVGSLQVVKTEDT